MEALKHAMYQPLEDGSLVGRVPELKGAIAFGHDREQCETELFSAIEGWAEFRVQGGRELPVMSGVDVSAEFGDA